MRRQGLAIFSACAGYGVIVGPVSFLLLLEPALRFTAVLCPIRLRTGLRGQNLGLRLCVHKKP
jgi:hypothetical protein